MLTRATRLCYNYASGRNCDPPTEGGLGPVPGSNVLEDGPHVSFIAGRPGIHGRNYLADDSGRSAVAFAWRIARLPVPEQTQWEVELYESLRGAERSGTDRSE